MGRVIKIDNIMDILLGGLAVPPYVCNIQDSRGFLLLLACLGGKKNVKDIFSWIKGGREERKKVLSMPL